MDGAKDFSLLAATVGILLTSLIIVEAAGVTSESSIHDILTQYGLPVGLMPDSVKNYTLSEDGHFVVELEKPCYVQFNYLVYYDRTIEGVLRYGEIADLSGVEAKEFFIWVHVTGIQVDLPSSKYIYFKVGPISKKIEISWFDSVPTCESRGKENCNEIHPAHAEVLARKLHDEGNKVETRTSSRKSFTPLTDFQEEKVVDILMRVLTDAYFSLMREILEMIAVIVKGGLA